MITFKKTKRFIKLNLEMKFGQTFDYLSNEKERARLRDENINYLFTYTLDQKEKVISEHDRLLFTHKEIKGFNDKIREVNEGKLNKYTLIEYYFTNLKTN